MSEKTNQNHTHVFEGHEKKSGCCGSGKHHKHDHDHKHEHGKGGCCGNHDHEHGKGCNHDHDHAHDHAHDHDHEHEHGKIYLETESGEELECDVLGIFEFEGQEYIAIIPVDAETAYLYRYSEIDEEPALNQIESEEEYTKVSAHFMELVEDTEE